MCRHRNLEDWPVRLTGLPRRQLPILNASIVTGFGIWCVLWCSCRTTSHALINWNQVFGSSIGASPSTKSSTFFDHLIRNTGIKRRKSGRMPGALPLCTHALRPSPHRRSIGVASCSVQVGLVESSTCGKGTKINFQSMRFHH